MNETVVRGDRANVFATCEQMGEAAVLADLERSGSRFQSRAEDAIAWEWVYEQRIKRDIATGEALRNTAKQTMYVAAGTFLVALFTAAIVATDYFTH